jgi:RNA polymerase sigma-70 factor, ECF subfamily
MNLIAAWTTEGWVRDESQAAEPALPVTERLRAMSSRELNRAYRIAGLLLGNAQDAEDATQDALLRAWSSAASQRDPARFDAWFDRILVNACRDRLRRRSRIRFIELEGQVSPASADPFGELIERDDVLRRLTVLDDDLRLVVVLHYWGDLRLEDLAERVGWPVGTVKSRLNRALTKLRHQVDHAGLTDAAGGDR